jgi:hypothetical protein
LKFRASSAVVVITLYLSEDNLYLIFAMKISHVLSRTQSNESLVSRKHVPWTASPLDKIAMSSSGREGSSQENKVNVDERVVQFDKPNGHHSIDDVPIFKPHRESSTIELFYDLFFVANLTVFTKNHEVKSGKGEPFQTCTVIKTDPLQHLHRTWGFLP